MEQAFTRAIETLGGFDTVIHAAGSTPSSPAESIAVDDWDRVFAINARGTFLVDQAAFDHLKGKGGRILSFAPGAGASGLIN